MKYLYIVKNIVKNNIVLSILFLFEIIFVVVFILLSTTKYLEIGQYYEVEASPNKDISIVMPGLFVQESLANDKVSEGEKLRLRREYLSQIKDITKNNASLSNINNFDINIDGQQGLLVTYDKNTLKLLGHNISGETAILYESNNSKISSNKINITQIKVTDNGDEKTYKNRSAEIIKKEKYSGKIFYPIGNTTNVDNLSTLYYEFDVDFVLVMENQKDLPTSQDLARIIFNNEKEDMLKNNKELSSIGYVATLDDILKSTKKMDKQLISETLSLDIPVYITTIITFVAMTYINISRQKKNFTVYRMLGADNKVLIISYLLYITIFFIVSITFSTLILNNLFETFNYNYKTLFLIVFILYGIAALVSIYPINKLIKNTIIYERKE
ncbi:MAG: FtsX-like permease family protein [Erysipelotrichales bacterium]